MFSRGENNFAIRDSVQLYGQTTGIFHGTETFTFDFADIAGYYDLCVGLMQRCQNEFSENFTLQYEDLVKRPIYKFQK